jgi:hypothetical protein
MPHRVTLCRWRRGWEVSWTQHAQLGFHRSAPAVAVNHTRTSVVANAFLGGPSRVHAKFEIRFTAQQSAVAAEKRRGAARSFSIKARFEHICTSREHSPSEVWYKQATRLLPNACSSVHGLVEFSFHLDRPPRAAKLASRRTPCGDCVLWWSAFVTFWSKTRHRARAVRCPSMFSEYCHQAPTS